MLFNSYEFMFLFFPIAFFVYFILNKQKLIIASKAWMVFASLFFYSWWDIRYLPLILISIIFNFSVGTALSRIDHSTSKRKLSRKSILIFGITANLILLGYYKYADFFLQNVGYILNDHFTLLKIVLPLGISFFTFTQIAYLVDAYKEEVKEMDYLNYSLFVTFFPHLIAGPILHHSEMMPQFDNLRKKFLNYRNISTGIFLFSIGLFKKVIIADTFSVWATAGFDHSVTLTFLEAWATSLSYSCQLYFDFSGYTDMALGISMMFNIFLPINFNSPYKAENIQDFWRRWHMTLSRFLRDYLYIPLGGNKKGELITCRNLVLTFLLGGLWHGAGWTFILWGLIHGLGLVINRLWKKLGIKMHRILAIFITFNFVNIAWIFFRARTLEDGIKVFKGMFGLNGIILPNFVAKICPPLEQFNIPFGGIFNNISGPIELIPYLIITLCIVFIAKNSMEMVKEFKPTWKIALFAAIIFITAILNMEKVTEFLYFNF